jgi:hypothetical protein
MGFSSLNVRIGKGTPLNFLKNHDLDELYLLSAYHDRNLGKKLLANFMFPELVMTGNIRAGAKSARHQSMTGSPLRSRYSLSPLNALVYARNYDLVVFSIRV